MEQNYSNKYINIEDNNLSNPMRINKSFNNSYQRDNNNTAYTTFNNSTQNRNNISNLERYKNQQLLNQTRLRNFPCNCTCHFDSSNSSRCNHCHLHHFHIHHIHVPRRNLNEIINFDNLSNFKTANTSFTNSNNLLKEVTELRNECRKFKEELDRSINEHNAGNKYIRELENEINKNNNKNTNNNNENNYNERNNNFNRYHDMLNKSFDVLRSVSNKSKDKNCKTKGEVYYYMNKNDDFEQLIQAQKNWIDNLPDDNTLPQNLPNINPSTSKTYSINDQNQDNPDNNNNIYGLNNNYFNNCDDPNQRDNDINNNTLNKDINKYNQGKDNKPESNNYNDNNYQNNQMKGNNTGTNPSRHYFDSKRNNNKGYIIKRGDKMNNNFNESNNGENQPLSNIINDNYKTFPENMNNNYEEEDNNNEEEEKNSDNNLNDNKNKTDPYLNNQNENNKKNENSLNKNDDDNNNNDDNKEEENESNPLDERYLILDENGNPITVNGNKLLGMELIPLIGEDEKEVIDDNGNIILIGPDGQPKTQDELQPIILDNDKPLVNEENKPYLGFCGVPLINGEGNPIVGPDELYDKDNNVVEGIFGMVAKDNMGNPIKVNINDNNKKKSNDNINSNNNNKNNNKDELDENNNYDIDDNNNDNYIASKSNKSNNKDNNKNNGNINIEERENQNNNGDLNQYKKLKPLIGPDGIPLRDSDNNHIFLDENNIPVKNPGISVLTDKTGKPVLNALGMPILIDREGNLLNTNEEAPPKKVYYYKKDLKTYGNQEYPKDSPVRKDSFKIGFTNGNNKILNNMKNRKRMNMNNNNERRVINYSECNPESLKKINFMRPYSNPFYDDNEYKVKCFACNLGCGVSKSGYSPMNFSPYNNLIRRRSITPLKNYNQLKKSKKTTNANIRKINMENDNNYYLTGN